MNERLNIEDARQLVKEFMLAYGQFAPPTPFLPSGFTRQLRHDLTDEENKELLEAGSTEDALDAICDKLYVLLGDAVAYGFSGEQVERAFQIVHESNMNKLWTGPEVTDARLYGEPVTAHGADYFRDFDNKFEVKDVGNGRYIVKTKEGKVIKSPSWVPPSFDGIIE